MTKQSTKKSTKSKTKSAKKPATKPKTADKKTASTKATPSTAKSAEAKKTLRRADQYNDPNHNYLKYWEGRDYEDAAERVAFRRLLKGKHFKHAVDVGGGYGRLCIFLEKYADKVTLA